MSSDVALRVDALGKCYHIYDAPQHRLLQMLARGRRRLYREFWALRNVSFQILRGECVGIVGRNGSGKSTLLQLICGTLAPSEGGCEADGRIAALLELGSGFNPEFSGRENVFLNAALLGLTPVQTQERYADICAFADIGNFIDQPVKTYSSGMVVRLAFAVAVHVEPQFLVVDEALAVGDELFQRKCFSRIEQLRSAGVTILLVSHSGATVMSLCDRALLLDAGELLRVGPAKEIVGCYQRLLYAPEDRRAEIRTEIGSHLALPDLSAANAQVQMPVQGAALSRELDESSEEYFDPDLQPQSTIAYEPRGARIDGVQILDAEGRRVNCLCRGRRYRFTYEVQFDRPATAVRLGMLIKTVAGVELGGILSAPEARTALSTVEAGTRLRAQFEFLCSVNSGSYFLNAGVVGIDAGEEIFLHRVLDACIFRVLPQGPSITTGIIDFMGSAHIVELAGAAPDRGGQ